MTTEKINFDDLNKVLSTRIREFLPSWLPGGRMVGNEYNVSSLRGGIGDSLRFNVIKCIGSDFATGEKFGDVIDLYAKINNLTQIESAKQLADQFMPKPPAPALILKTKLPPDDSYPNVKHYKLGDPTATYCYRNSQGDPIYYICRYDSQSGKQFYPWSYFNDDTWKMKAQDEPRPLYLLDEIESKPLNFPILVVEGEKAAEAAKKFVSNVYAVTTWSNGAQSFNKTNWKPIHGRSILIWPDADKAGVKCAQEIAKILSPFCPEIKIINVPLDGSLSEGFDAADSYFTWNNFVEWAKPLIEVYNHNPKPELIQKPPQKTNEPDADPIDGSLYAIWDKIGIARTAQGQPIANLDNALRVLEGFPLFTDIIWFDEFHQKYYTLWNSSSPREWGDIDDFRLTTFMQRRLGLIRISDDMINKAIRVHGKNNTRNEPKDWMESLKWDGVERISEFLYKCAGAELNYYVKAISKNFWLTIVARIYFPGCQVDNMIVFEGEQGKGKTSLLRAIGQNWYCSAKEKVDSNNFFLMLQGKLLIEIAELDSFNRAETTRIKQVVSDPVDRYRSPYDRATEDHPRQSIFVGTTNEYAYLRDDTGGRRFWPVKCGDINISLALDNRDQLFAEAVHLIKSENHLKQTERMNSCWWRTPDSAADEQEQRRQIDPWEKKIYDYIIQKYEVTVAEIIDDCIRIESSKQTRYDEMRIGKILHQFKWVRTRRRREGGLNYVYLSPNALYGKKNEQF